MKSLLMKSLLMKSLCMAVLFVVTASQAFPQSAAKPTEEHERLARNLGKRGGILKVWPQGPGSPSIEMPFSETNTSVLGGFWVQSKFSSGPYNGQGMTGYDPKEKKYIGTWMNNMSSTLNIMKGTYDEKTHSMTLYFDDVDPMTGEPTKMKTVTQTKPDQPETMTMYKQASESDEWEVSFILTYEESK